MTFSEAAARLELDEANYRLDAQYRDLLMHRNRAAFVLGAVITLSIGLAGFYDRGLVPLGWTIAALVVYGLCALLVGAVVAPVWTWQGHYEEGTITKNAKRLQDAGHDTPVYLFGSIYTLRHSAIQLNQRSLEIMAGILTVAIGASSIITYACAIAAVVTNNS